MCPHLHSLRYTVRERLYFTGKITVRFNNQYVELKFFLNTFCKLLIARSCVTQNLQVYSCRRNVNSSNMNKNVKLQGDIALTL